MNILVTAIGAFAGDIVIKTLRAKQHHVIGCDILPKEWIADAYNIDQFVQAPRVTNKEEYSSFIKNVCEQFAVQYIMPLTDPEVVIICEMKDELLAMGVTACVPDPKVTRLCCDKYLLTKYLERENICPVIPTYLLNAVSLPDESNESALHFPLLAKPRFGRSSQGVITIRNQTELEYVKEMAQHTEYIIQPYIEGDILAVDAVRASDNTVVCIARRELLRSLSGAGTTVEIIDDPALNQICRRITSSLGIVGAANYEFIQNGDKLYFMEANPRFAGGVEFSHIAGYDVVSNHLKCFTGESIDAEINLKKLIIARKYEEYITEVL